ncbi:uncharacterized protein LOC143296138 [Babylonia areolata]|uniref:uncharacterized protein LOC143296138 n=1 Tax=Babylonia areolata TaxID=304850 RepID=UPI003FD3D368
MVRVISEKLFSPPRSRHSSGEAVDKELAARAVEALSGLHSARRAVGELSDYESSSDSHWDSEVDVEGDGAGPSEECGGGANDVLQKRKERRRERNKLSAQAYRIRRREQCVKQQHVLKELQEKNSRLKDQVHSLEDQIDHFRRTAVVRPPPPPPPPPAPTSPAVNTLQTLDRPPGGQPPPPCVGWEGPQGRSSRPPRLPLMDNHLSRSQLLSPVVDNFSFSPTFSSQLSPSPSSPAASPALSLSPCSASSSSCLQVFSFPGPSPSGGSRAAGRHMTPTVFPTVPFGPHAACAVGERVGQEEGVLHHPHPRFQLPPPPPPTQHMDLNANAEEGHGDNLNAVLHSKAAGLEVRQKNDNMNNNTGCADFGGLGVPTASVGGARPKVKAVTGYGLYPAASSPEVFKYPKI